MLLSFKIALRFSQRQLHGNIASIISATSIIGIALGVAILIIALSAMNGFEYELSNRILAVFPHGEIEPVDKPFSDWKKIIKRIRQVPGILHATPYLNFTGLVERGNKIQVIQVKSLDLEKESQVGLLPKYVVSNDWRYFIAGKYQIIIGYGVAKTLQVKRGDWITLLVSPISNTQTKLLHLNRLRLQVRGILKLNSQLDNNFAIVPLEDAQNYLRLGQNISGIAIKVNDIFKANKLVQDAGKVVINSDVRVRHWISTYGHMYRDIQIIRSIIYLAIILMMGIACFNIVSTLMIAVKDKSTDIAILRTLGAKDRMIYAIFICYGLLVGLIGSVVGAIIGVLISFNLTKLIKGIENLLEHHLLSEDIYFINFLPTQLYWIDVTKVLATTLLLGVLASIYPAWRASLIDPVRILKNT